MPPSPRSHRDVCVQLGAWGWGPVRSSGFFFPLLGWFACYRGYRSTGWFDDNVCERKGGMGGIECVAIPRRVMAGKDDRILGCVFVSPLAALLGEGFLWMSICGVRE